MKPSLVIKAFLAVSFAACLLIPLGAAAQQVEISSTLNPVGSGARATGMGGAFIGIADDATAASWNPGGLIQLEKPELSLVYARFSREQTYHPDLHPEMNTTNTVDTSALNYASAAYPFVWLNRNMIVSLNYQRLYEMDKMVNAQYDYLPALKTLYDLRQEGYLYALSPAFAVQLRPGLSAGVTLNVWRDYAGKNGWDNTVTLTGLNVPLHYRETNTYEFEGYNAHLGVLWNVSGPVTLGLVYKTPFEATLNHAQAVNLDYTSGLPPAVNVSEETMRMPASYGAGLQYRHSDSFTLALDVYRTDWSRFVLKDQTGYEMNPLDANPLAQGTLRSTTQVRFGVEYLFIGNDRTIPLRAGLFADPEPGIGHVNRFSGISFGTGYSTPRFSLDLSYQYRSGENVDGDIAPIEGRGVDIIQQTLMASLIYYF